MLAAQHGAHLRNKAEAAALQQVSRIALEVQEAAVRGLGKVQGTRHAPLLGRRGDPAAAVEDHEGVQLAVTLLGDGRLEALAKAVHQVLQADEHSKWMASVG